MSELKYHPIACIFPMMEEKEIWSLAATIKDQGQINTGLLFEGMILDGRNRYEACKIAGVEFKATEFKGTKSEALTKVWLLNHARRHLTSSQAAVSESLRAKLDAEYAAELEAIRDEKKARPEAGRPAKTGSKNSGAIIDPNKKRDNSKRTNAVRAKAVGTNRSYIDKSDELVSENLELAQEVLAGKKSLPKAMEEHKAKGKPPMTDSERAKHNKKVIVDHIGEAVRTLGDLNAVAPNLKLLNQIRPKIDEVDRLIKSWKV